MKTHGGNYRWKIRQETQYFTIASLANRGSRVGSLTEFFQFKLAVVVAEEPKQVAWKARSRLRLTGVRNRLEAILDASYLGLPYFSDEETALLKSTIIEPEAKHYNYKLKKKSQNEARKTTLEMLIEEDLKEKLERRMKKRVDSGDFRACAAHDLAPILEKAFDINPKHLANDTGFSK